tara:strand:+ start:498 stop:1103 length:606 start_codon:yes stop_codon:yes gene_type:complete
MKEKLKLMLKEILPIFEGTYFVADGALLGIVREGDLLDFDDDVDIYILPTTIINWYKLPDKYKYFKDYMAFKIYDETNPKPKPISDWLRFIQYTRTLPQYIGYNRANLCKAIAPIYRAEIIPNICHLYNIDIFVLEHDSINDRYKIPYLWNKQEFFFTKKECETEIDSTLGFNIRIPKNPLDVLQRIYGDDFMIENREHTY